MIRNWELEKECRVQWIQDILKEANAKGIVIGLSGGKDSAIVAALCKTATSAILGIALPCNSSNPDDIEHAKLLADTFKIKFIKAELDAAYDVIQEYVDVIDYNILDENKIANQYDKDQAKANIKPRLRMTMLYAVARLKNYLVAGTGNRSEAAMGYYTKWGDGAHDFNPIADLTVTELFEFGRYLGVPEEIMSKAPSAGLWEGQTDEQDLGITYKEIDDYIIYGKGDSTIASRIETATKRNKHKTSMPITFKN